MVPFHNEGKNIGKQVMVRPLTVVRRFARRPLVGWVKI